MKIERVTLEIDKYFTDKGEHTCAIDFENGETCRFLGSRKFGVEMICMLSIEIVYDDLEGGFLKPCKSCILSKLGKRGD